MAAIERRHPRNLAVLTIEDRRRWQENNKEQKRKGDKQKASGFRLGERQPPMMANPEDAGEQERASERESGPQHRGEHGGPVCRMHVPRGQQKAVDRRGHRYAENRVAEYLDAAGKKAAHGAP